MWEFTGYFMDPLNKKVVKKTLQVINYFGATIEV